MIDASSVKEGFRVFRTQADTLLFKLANGSHTLIDDNNSACYYVQAPGRYVVESGSGCRRISDAQIYDCIRSLRTGDRFVHIMYMHGANWPHCFVTYLANGDSRTSWTILPMQPSAIVKDAWTATIDAPLGLQCTFCNDPFSPDIDTAKKFSIHIPGRYTITHDNVIYKGASPLDMV